MTKELRARVVAREEPFHCVLEGFCAALRYRIPMFGSLEELCQ